MNTTISISTEIRDKIKEFGSKGETYTKILEKLYKSAVERQVHDILMDDKDSISIDKAIEISKKRWQK